MRFLTANTFYKFVNQFSFIGNKSHLKSLTNEDLLWKVHKNQCIMSTMVLAILSEVNAMSKYT